jgi:hypothetical protein
MRITGLRNRRREASRSGGRRKGKLGEIERSRHGGGIRKRIRGRRGMNTRRRAGRRKYIAAHQGKMDK